VLIVLFASIPNPLSRLDGHTCGRLLIPFWTFFIATAIGKACSRTTLQAFFFIFACKKETLEAIKVHTSMISMVKQTVLRV
jgi:hypothetical protein